MTIVKRAEDAGADGLELNFGCPHGMSERGMGSAVGQVPEYTSMITGWVKEDRTHARAGEADSERGRHPAGRARSHARRSGRHLCHQHHQLDHRRRSRYAESAAERSRPVVTRRLLRTRGKADRAAHGAADCGGRGVAASDLRHRRHLRMARGCGIYPARSEFPSSLHRPDALRIPHRGRHDRRPCGMDATARDSRRSTTSAVFHCRA